MTYYFSIFLPVREGGYAIFFPDFPEIASEGETVDECMVMARKYNITILRTDETTSELVSTMIATLKHYLAPRLTRHGVLVEVHGE